MQLAVDLETSRDAKEQVGQQQTTARWQPNAADRFWCVLPMWLALIPLLAMGLWWPSAFSHYFAVIAVQLSGGAR